MNYPIQPIILSIPAIIYIIVLKRKGQSYNTAFKNLGLTIPKAKYLLWAFVLGIFSIGVAYSIQKWISPGVLQNKSTASNFYSSWHLGIGTVLLAFCRELVYTTFGEEIFFRGFLGRVLFTRFGFRIGNLIQAAIFLAPHLFLLSISTAFAPTLVFVAIMGWVIGWLRFRSNSIFPGLLLHTMANTFSAAFVMI